MSFVRFKSFWHLFCTKMNNRHVKFTSMASSKRIDVHDIKTLVKRLTLNITQHEARTQSHLQLAKNMYLNEHTISIVISINYSVHMYDAGIGKVSTQYIFILAGGVATKYQLFCGIGICSPNLSKYAACLAGSSNYSNRNRTEHSYVHTHTLTHTFFQHYSGTLG